MNEEHKKQLESALCHGLDSLLMMNGQYLSIHPEHKNYPFVVTSVERVEELRKAVQLIRSL